jgi:hypothetical protein
VLCEGDMDKFDRSRSCMEDVEMCCAFGVSYDSDVSRVVWVIAWDSSVAVLSIVSCWDGCSS